MCPSLVALFGKVQYVMVLADYFGQSTVNDVAGLETILAKAQYGMVSVDDTEMALFSVVMEHGAFDQSTNCDNIGSLKQFLQRCHE